MNPELMTVYIHKDAAGSVLYVGITNSKMARQYEHNIYSEWWRFVQSVDVEHVLGREVAIKRESQLIQEFLPPFNRDQNPNHAELRLSYYRSVGVEVPTQAGVAPVRSRSPLTAEGVLEALRELAPNVAPRGPDRIIDVTAAADRLAMSTTRLAALCKKGESPVAAVKRGSGPAPWLFSAHSIDDYIERLFSQASRAG